jgi:predicted ATP-dependent endonuclease of OLD family
MKLEKCRIQNYRCITDSGWVDFDDISVIVGRNESGKTSFLKALWRLKPYQDIGYNIDREWPSGRRKEKSPEKVVVEAEFSFSKKEQKEIATINESAKGIHSVLISRNYAGEYAHIFSPDTPNTEHEISWVVDLLNSKLEELPVGFSEHFQAQYRNAFTALLAEIRDLGGSDCAISRLAEIKRQLTAFCSPTQPQHNQDQQNIPLLSKIIDEVISEIEDTPLMRVVDYVHHHMPTFIYMDDYRMFVGSAQLDEVQRHKNLKKLEPVEETIIMIMDMAGLDLDEEVKKGNQDDREQRMLDMNDASNTLTELIAERWSQRKYQVVFQADGQHFMTFVKDQNDKGLVPLEERSKGFQWFFSFDMHFMYETEGNFSNAIILLDEPGLHLHAAAQRDLLERMKAYAKDNQLVYTTHLPFMIDFKRLDNIFVAEEIPKEGTKIHTNWATADKDARFTLQAALGLSWSQSLFVGQYNLVVEGVDDFWFLTTFSSLFEEAGQPGLDMDLVVTPAGGASKVAYVGTILHGQDLHVAVLLDSDPAGEQAFEQLVHQWILDEKMVIMVGDAIGAKPCALEDLFGESYYLAKVFSAYTKELGGKSLALDPKTAGKRSLVHRVEDAFEKKKLGNFNKGRVAKRIMTELGKADLASLDKDTVASFRKVIDTVNQIVAKWKQ